MISPMDSLVQEIQLPIFWSFKQAVAFISQCTAF